VEEDAPHSEILRRLESVGLKEAAYARLKALVELLERGGGELLEPLDAHFLRAEESSRLKTLFLRLVSRELGGPFEALRRRVVEMGEEPDLWKLREGLAELAETVYRLDRLVRSLIDTAAIESGVVQLREGAVDLASLISDRIGKRLRRLRGYRIQPEVPAGSLVVRGDRERLSLLVDDLLDAAVHLSPQGGTILVRLAREGGEVLLSAQNRTARLPAGRLGSFLEWLGGDIEGAEGLEGTGISLYRAYRTAEMFGGRMELAAPPEGGASFIVRIPSAEAKKP